MPGRRPTSRGAAAASASDDDRTQGARFARDLARVGGDGAVNRLALAVSGGPDSMAMLLLAHAAMPGRIVVGTVDHRLREGSANEASLVARECARLGVPQVTLTPHTPIAGASLQARAREARYALLARWAAAQGAMCLATAHHADDQAETFLMRASRGSGLSGLAGVRPRTVIAGIAVVRPLLDWRRAELRAIVRRAGIAFVDDPSNADRRHVRTRYRALLELNEWLDIAGIAAAAGHVAEADADVRATIDWLWEARASGSGDDRSIDVAGLPRELRRRLARRAIGAVRLAAAIDVSAWSEASAIEPLLDALLIGKAATQAGVRAAPKGDIWRFRPAPLRRLPAIAIRVSADAIGGPPEGSH